MPTECEACTGARAVVLRPKNGQKVCKTCFIRTFEDEVHATITAHGLFRPGERVAIGASGGKDSTVLAAVLQTLNARHGYGLDLALLSIDEGIRGYRDDSLAMVRRHAAEYGLPLTVLGYAELYGWTMDQVVAQVGRRRNCTYCGVFRRQALDRGAARLGVAHVVTGHNADDAAETVLMNLLRGDLARLARASSIVTAGAAAGAAGGAASAIRRSKPLLYAYEKEIVLYAHHRRLAYFSTECVYSPEAFRGSARALIKDLERLRPRAILDVVRSGADLARLVPDQGPVAAARPGVGVGAGAGALLVDLDEETGQGCGGGAAGSAGAARMAELEKQLRVDEGARERETEIKTPLAEPKTDDKPGGEPKTGLRSNGEGPRRLPKAQLGRCERCGYMSSQRMCKACVLLEGLNKGRPKVSVQIEVEEGAAGEQQRSPVVWTA